VEGYQCGKDYGYIRNVREDWYFEGIQDPENAEAYIGKKVYFESNRVEEGKFDRECD